MIDCTVCFTVFFSPWMAVANSFPMNTANNPLLTRFDKSTSTFNAPFLEIMHGGICLRNYANNDCTLTVRNAKRSEGTSQLAGHTLVLTTSQIKLSTERYEINHR